MNNRSIPDARVIPVLLYPDPREAAEWLCRALGFTERLRIANHRVQLTFGEGAIVVRDGTPAPSGSIMLRVGNADAAYERALAAGARGENEPETHAFGERQCTIQDFAGYRWTLSQSVDDVDPASWGGELVG